MKVLLVEDIKEKVADEIMLRLLETDFKVVDLDAHIDAVRHKFPQLSAREIEQIGIDGKLFPAQEVTAFRASQAPAGETAPPPAPVQTRNDEDHSGPHQSALAFIQDAFRGVSHMPNIRREDLYRQAHRFDPALTKDEFNAEAARAMKLPAERKMFMKPRPEGTEGPRCFLGVSETYRERDDYFRKKVVVKHLSSTYQLPADPQKKQQTIADIRTALAMAGIGSATDSVIVQDVACWRTAFLYYCATPAVREKIEQRMKTGHPSTTALTILIEDGFRTWQDLGFDGRPEFGKEEEGPALEWLQDAIAVPPEANDGRNNFANFLERSVAFRADDVAKNRQRIIFPHLLEELQTGVSIPRHQLLDEIQHSGDKALTSGQLSNEIALVRSVIHFYCGNERQKHEADAARQNGKQAGLLLKKLYNNGFLSLADFDRNPDKFDATAVRPIHRPSVNSVLPCSAAEFVRQNLPQGLDWSRAAVTKEIIRKAEGQFGYKIKLRTVRAQIQKEVKSRRLPLPMVAAVTGSSPSGPRIRETSVVIHDGIAAETFRRIQAQVQKAEEEIDFHNNKVQECRARIAQLQSDMQTLVKADEIARKYF